MTKPTILALKPKPIEPAEVLPKAEAPAQDQQVIFQAIGIIRGDVVIEGDKASIKIGGKTYPLNYPGGTRKGYDALIKTIQDTGITQRRLTLYPRITHFPGSQPYQLGFQVVAFDKHDEPRTEGISGELKDFEFKISGLWQFIPVCRVPCISVFKNFTRERLEFIKSAPVDKKVNFMKASHIPVVWRDAPVPPFRFNPKLDKETQGKASFVQIKARFNGDRDAFEFLSLLGISDSPPNYLKAGKKDKAEATKTKLAASKGRKRSSSPVLSTAAKKTSGATSSPKPKPKAVGKSEVS